MKSLTLAALLLTCTSGLATAQTPPPPPAEATVAPADAPQPPAADRTERPEMADAPRPETDAPQRGNGNNAGRENHDRDGQRQDRGNRAGHDTAARFAFELKGGGKLDIACGDAPIAACIDAARPLVGLMTAPDWDRRRD